MLSHVRKTTDPVVEVKVRVPPPGVAVITGAAPLAARDVVVEIHVYLLRGELLNNGIEDLPRSVSMRP